MFEHTGRVMWHHGKSGGNICWAFSPILEILLMYLVIVDGEAHDNAYGPVPANTLG